MDLYEGNGGIPSLSRAELAGWKIGIAGLGGLGSNIACYLARSGFFRFALADFDVVEASNLNRQFYFGDQIGKAKTLALGENLLRINPALDLELHQVRLDEANLGDVFADCRCLVEAFDQAAYKAMLVRIWLASGKLLVSGSGLAGWGGTDRIAVRKVKDHFYLVGDQETAVDAEHPPLAPRVNVVAAMMADVILAHALENTR